MLVITRKKGQTLIVDGRITIEIRRVEGGRVHVGIDAPPECKILRGELEPHEEPPAEEVLHG